MIYDGKKDGFGASKFHENCDNKGKTILIIKSEHGRIFGAYADKEWHSNGEEIKGNGKSFLFSFSKGVMYKCL